LGEAARREFHLARHADHVAPAAEQHGVGLEREARARHADRTFGLVERGAFAALGQLLPGRVEHVVDGCAPHIEARGRARAETHLLGPRRVVEDQQVVAARPEHPLVVGPVVVPVGRGRVFLAVVDGAEHVGRQRPIREAEQDLRADVGQDDQAAVGPAHGGHHPTPGALHPSFHGVLHLHAVQTVRIPVVEHDPDDDAVDHGNLPVS
jgi:hypothetical protein